MSRMLNFADTGGLSIISRSSRTFLAAHRLAGRRFGRLAPGHSRFDRDDSTVRDAFSITAMFRDVGFVDRPYSRTEIGEDVNILDTALRNFIIRKATLLWTSKACRRCRSFR